MQGVDIRKNLVIESWQDIYGYWQLKPASIPQIPYGVAKFLSRGSDSRIVYVRPSVHNQNPSASLNHAFWQNLSLSLSQPISHYANQPSCHSATIPPPSQPLRIITIDHHAYQPSFLSAIIPTGHHMCAFWSEFATFKPIGLFLGTPCIVLLHFTNKEHFNHKYLWKVFQKQMIWWFLGTILCLFQL